jgi:hypothetical protein
MPHSSAMVITRETYVKKAGMHEQYLRECRMKRRTNDTYAAMIDEVAADMAFCDRAAASFNADPTTMISRLKDGIGFLVEHGPSGLDIDPKAFSRSLERKMKEFERVAANGEHFIP